MGGGGGGGWTTPVGGQASALATPVGSGMRLAGATSPVPPFASLSTPIAATGPASLPSATYGGTAAQRQHGNRDSAPGPKAGGQLQGQQGRSWQRPVNARHPLFAKQFHDYVSVRGAVRAAFAWVLLVVPLLVVANALFNVLGSQPWYVRTLRMPADAKVEGLIALQLAATAIHANVLDVPAPGDSKTPVSTPYATAALMLKLSTILSTLGFACIGACSAALLFWWKVHQLLPVTTDADPGLSAHEVATVATWWFRCFYLGGGAVGLAHGIMLRWARKHVLSFPPHQRRILPRLRESLCPIAVGAISCVLRAMVLVMVLLAALAIAFHGRSITRSSWWADRLTTTVLALGLTPSSVCQPTASILILVSILTSVHRRCHV